MDAHANFAYAQVAVAPAPALSGTTLSVSVGLGVLFPAPPFNVVVWPAAPAMPLKSNAEIVRCTGLAGDGMTIVRAQEGTSARSILVGDQIALAVTAKSLTDIESLLALMAMALVPTGLKFGPYAAQPNDFVPVDATAGSVTITLPAAPADKTRIGVKKIDSSTNTVVIQASGADVFNKAGGGVTLTLLLVNQAMSFQYQASTGIWYLIASDTPLGQLDARYTAVAAAVGGDLTGTLPNPTIATGVVTSAKIADGTIVDGDISGAAAIAKSKLASLAIVDADVNTISPGKITGTAVITSDSRLSDQRTPLDNSVTTAKIADGAILDADVNAGAAIAESKLNLATDAAAGVGSRRTLGSGALQATAGNDSRLSDARTPTAHAVTHKPGGTDAIDWAGSIIAQGTDAGKPAAGATNAGTLYYATDTGVVYRSTGAAWKLYLVDPDWNLIYNGGTVYRETLPARQMAAANLAFAGSGIMNFVGIPLIAGDVITDVTWRWGATAAVGPTHWWCALYDTQATPALIAQSADQTTTAISNANTTQTLVGGPYTITVTGLYQIAIMVAVSTTMPTLCGINLGQGAAGAGLVGTQKRMTGSSGSALTNVAPASLAAPVNALPRFWALLK